MKKQCKYSQFFASRLRGKHTAAIIFNIIRDGSDVTKYSREVTKMKKIVSVILTLALALGLALPAVAEDAIKIGVIGPLTGPAAIYGTAVVNAAKIAADELNALGGLQIEIDAQDDEHDPKKAINAYNTVLDNGAKVIVGTVTSGPCAAVAAKAYEERIFMLTPSASSTDVIADKDNVYQVCFTDPAQGAASAQYIAENGLATKVAVIYNNGDVLHRHLPDPLRPRPPSWAWRS